MASLTPPPEGRRPIETGFRAPSLFKAGLLAGGIAVVVALSPIALTSTPWVQHAWAQTDAPAAAAPGTEALPQLPSFRPIVDKVLPAVVNISVTQKLGGG